MDCLVIYYSRSGTRSRSPVALPIAQTQQPRGSCKWTSEAATCGTRGTRALGRRCTDGAPVSMTAAENHRTHVP
jgi:hypothetical protein